MTPLTAPEEDRLRERLAGRADALEVAPPFPQVDPTAVGPSRERVAYLAVAAAFVLFLVALATVARTPSATEIADTAAGQAVAACEDDGPVWRLLMQCNSSPNTMMILLFVLAALGFLLVLTRLQSKPKGRIVSGALLMTVALGLVYGAVGWVDREVDRATPSIEAIEQQFGGPLTCTEWYDLEAETRNNRVSPNSQFSEIDPALVRDVVDGGPDIYLWGLFAFPILLFATLLGVAAVGVQGERVWRAVFVVLFLLVLGYAVQSFPDGKIETSITCMLE